MLAHLWRLAKAGFVLARHDAVILPGAAADQPRVLRLAMAVARTGRREGETGLGAALVKLGPSYIKLGQFLATRPDLVGMRQALSLQALQDRLPGFGMEQAEAAVAATLGRPVGEIFAAFGPPVAAASIAQVHRARTMDGRDVAVKVLRPGVAKRFARDLASFFFAARLAERFSTEARRLRPVAAVETLARSVALEMDLRMEASALSEMAETTRADAGFRVPAVDWARSGRDVLTMEWIAGTPLSDVAGLKARGLDLPRLAVALIQAFLTHAIRDGFFHADMHQGNLFADPEGRIVAIDLGIMGRIGPKEQLFLAEILYGFITRNYLRVAEVHFEAGYVPASQDVNNFAQALRAIGEPILGEKAENISMARLLTQLFEVTGQFEMRTQPQLILLQKTMVVVEGVARSLDPAFNMWAAADPVVRTWMERKLGPIGKVEAVGGHLMTLARSLASLPQVAADLRDRLAAPPPRDRSIAMALWVGVALLAVIAAQLVFW